MSPRFAPPIRLLALLSLLAPAAAAQGTPIGFEEVFALAEDRAAALEQLIPGTEDYYYYHCLHRQNSGALDEVPALLETWIQRHGRDGRVQEIESRQALLRFGEDPAAAYAHVIDRLGVRFDHQREVPGRKPDLPTALDPELVSLQAFADRAFRLHPKSVDGFRDSAFSFLSVSAPDEAILMSLLKRLDRPDFPGLPALVVRNLESRQSRGFGSLGIHAKLLLDQLEECARMRPTLLRDGAFIDAYLRRLRPSDDVPWRRDAAQREAYLERLWSFAQRLAPAENSLKAHVLHRRLLHDLELGRPDKARFLAYLRLPRSAGWVNPDFLKRERRGDGMVDTGRGFSTDFEPIGDDEPLVRAFLSHFFVTEDSYETYAPYVRDGYLSRLFAETKILAGIGDMERWYSMLDDPAYYEKLKERVEIEFPPDQRTDFGAREAVALEVDVKNVETLLVKVFEINTLEFYTAEGKEVDASINVDGLVANQESTHAYEDSPLRRIRRRFEFPMLQQPGVYVVEFIGNGLSSRAVVRKGRLQYLERIGAAGHVLRVLDEEGRHLRGASVRLGGREYEAGERGEIVLPFSTKPGMRPIVLRHGGRCTLEQLDHQGESYQLDAGIFLDRESLLSGRDARIVVRPKLRLNGEAVALALLEDPILTITSRDRDGVASSHEVRDLELTAAGELVHEIRVPEGLSKLSASLRGRVRNLSRGEDVDLDGGTETFTVNAIDATPQTFCPLLGRSAGGYALDVLGKNGEAIADHAVALTLRHVHFTDPLTVTLKTDASGRIALGALEDITHLSASGLPGGYGGWTLSPAERTYPTRIQGIAGETIRVPYQGDEAQLSRRVASLLEVRGGAFFADAFDRLALADGFLELRGLAPGSYDLFLKEADERIEVLVGSGEVRDGWAIGRKRMLEVGGTGLLHVTAIEAAGDELQVELANFDDETRVHVFSTRYLPAFDPFGGLWSPGGLLPNRVDVVHADSSYHSGREIGDEYRYILDRRYAKKFPGNMLRRPGLLLNPWALEETDSTIGMGGGAGGRFGGKMGGERRLRGAGGAARESAGSQPGIFPDLDFLPKPSVILANLRPGDDGVVRVPLADLGDGQLVHAVAVDRASTVYDSLALPEKDLAPVDRRLAASLDTGEHLTEVRRVELVEGGAGAVIEDVSTSDVETYDSLASVHRFFSTFTGDSDLARFAFVLEWPKLEEAKKRELYSEHACHELSFFLYHKDPAFFAEVIRPYLANKLHKTFLDRWLLDEDLSEYLDPWAFARLNVVEQILLSRRLEGEADAVARLVRERDELRPPDPEEESYRFETALKSEALSRGRGLREELGELRQSVAAKRAAPPPSGPATPGPSGGGEGARPRTAEAAPAEEMELEDALEEPVLADEKMARRKAEDKSKDLEALDLGRREQSRQLYRAPSRTRAFVEHNWWHRRIEQQVGDWIGVNRFWRDYAESRGTRPFFSTHFSEATSSFAEMMLALSVLDLPFEAGEHEIASEGVRLTLRAATPLLLVRKEITGASLGADRAPILLRQDFFRLDDRYEYEGNERRDKFVVDEFLEGVAYGCQVVLTNPTSVERKLELLLQIPEGAIPVQGGFRTRGVPVRVGAYGTATFEYAFYFPRTGSFAHYPVHAGSDGELVAFADPVRMEVVAEPSTIDLTSWEHVSQNGTPDEVMSYLETHNLFRIDLAKIAWRMRDRVFFRGVIEYLRRRHVYEHVLWSYGLRHADLGAAREYLRHAEGFLGQCGRYLDTPLVSIDPVERLAYQHIEYEPLFNGRAHRFGRRREILNRDFAAQYLSLMGILAYRPELDDSDWMSVTYYLLLQDRVEEALASFARVDPRNLATSLQYDYMQAYLDFFTDDRAIARGIAERYLEHPVKRWRAMFQDVVNQLDEAEGKGVATSDAEDRTQLQTELAASEPSLDLQVEASDVVVEYRNLERCEIGYYEMDIEFLFSTSPFVQQGSGSFAYVEPNRRDVVTLPAGEPKLTFPLPPEFQSANVLVEVRAAGLVRRQAYYANSLSVQMIENYGQLQVTHAETERPLPKVYVKVFARLQDGSIRFHKDGYTDLRGRYDYASLSGEGSGGVARYAILVLSEQDGAVIREADPPVE